MIELSIYMELERVTDIHYKALSDVRTPSTYSNECSLCKTFRAIAKPELFKMTAVNYSGRFLK